VPGVSGPVEAEEAQEEAPKAPRARKAAPRTRKTRKTVEAPKLDESGPVPANFLELARSGNTSQARAYWQRRCDNWGK
jgi:hypothetical protein